MQSWRIIILICLVNLSSVAFASDTGTPIRGPKALDQQSRIQQLGPITPTDTLWRLAQQVRPESGVDMYQVMYALYLKNPDAFLDNNFNHLRTGAMLEVPSIREMRAVDPTEARQKSTADDQSWARRTQAIRAEAEQTPAVVSQELQQSIDRIEQEQQQQLQQLRYRFGESMMLVEGIMEENMSIKSTLDAVQQQLDLLKQQLEQDAAVQQQLEALVREQGEWVAQQQALMDARAEQGFSAFWQQLAASPAFWAVAASVPALALLLALLFWVKRRSKRAEKTIEDATAEPSGSAHYQSPLPDVDESSDLDDSLFSLDDSLLDDAFNDDVDDSPVDLSDDLLDDDVLLDDSSAGDDNLFDEDDSLLSDDSLLDAESLLTDDDQPDASSDDEAETADADKAFDPDNILSGNDLDSLFAEADDLDDTLDQADDNDPFAEDELLEEIELDIPDDELPDDQTITKEDDFSDWADDVVDEDTDLNAAEEGDTKNRSQSEPESDDTELEASEGGQSASQQSEADEERFDSSELDAFAESLVDESLSDDDEIAQDISLEQGDEDVRQELQPDQSSVTNDDMDDADIDALFDAPATDEGANDSEVLSVTNDEMDDADIDALFDAPVTDEDADDELLSEDDDVAAGTAETEQKIEAAAEAEYLNDYADLEDEFPADDSADADAEQGPDLVDQDDESVAPLSAAARSVENPSEVLDDYPELELNEQDELLNDERVDDTDAPDETSAVELNEADDIELSDTDAAELDETDDSESSDAEHESTELENTDFDELLSELETMAQRVATHDADVDSTSADTGPDADKLVADDEFQDIDQLLAQASEKSPDERQDFTMDVDVSDYQDMLTSDSSPADHDNEYAAQLDLIRAYYEIDDQESAEQAIKAILASDAPDAIKDEVTQLQQARQDDEPT
ncbi:FimV/HubP family polar landmark protein [Alkalimonas collagenimarina]|uniref:FimV/HubP family polar landmark protein n=1 Tax=Alkalimonas collagenimarina TaxID=400390 RepID=A0ABT9GV99_9GAMM|nr:FimV/HubP family polar landmark protein [Alkalimonas collagenimarina]MDP4534977.1 FimV/HubP family polar landmark protein [Alkalimonas collagenimarina]